VSSTPPLPPTPPDPLRETLAAALGTQYELLAPLGRGAMGAVYLARERFLDRLVAVKALPAELASSPDARERFLREARTAARLTHPNVVPLYSFGEAGDTLFYVMGYVDGETLEARLRATTRLAPDDAARLLAEIADALHYAHEQGVVHRDIKPENILIDRTSGRAMLADFGIAKRGTGSVTLTGTGMVLGTPQYMSPEQAAGDRDIDGRSDLYALGVIGFRMLTGRLPFEGANVMELLAQHMTREAPPIVEPGVTPALAGVVRRALAKDPAARWPTGHAMRTALQPGTDDDPDDLLPERMRNALGTGVRAVVAAAAVAELALLVAFFGPETLAPTFGGVAVLTLILILGVEFPGMVKQSGWRRALALGFRKPRWWQGWWPSAARREDDVWDRLPAPIRFQRNVEAFGVLPLAASTNLFLWLVSQSTPGHRWAVLGAMLLGSAVPVGATATAFWRSRRWARAHALSLRDQQRIATEPTTGSAFWRRPEVAALLSPPTRSRTGPSLPRSPADHLRAIEALKRSDDARHRELIDGGLVAARELDVAIAQCDAELAELARDVAPEERARIEASVAALGAAAEVESDAKRRMRALLGDQLALLHGLERRRGEVLLQRERLAGHLHALWLALATLRADAALDAAETSEITGRIRAIHREVEIRSAAAAEVNVLAPGAIGRPDVRSPGRP
jgi:serine/threonine-protein kinase